MVPLKLSRPLANSMPLSTAWRAGCVHDVRGELPRLCGEDDGARHDPGLVTSEAAPWLSAVQCVHGS